MSTNKLKLFMYSNCLCNPVCLYKYKTMHYQMKYLTKQQIAYKYKIMHYQMKYLTKQQNYKII